MVKPRLFYDMDNTLALMSIYGKEEDALTAMSKKGFFLNLPVLDDADIVLKRLVISGYDVHILSACINSLYCYTEKLDWLERYFPFIPKCNIHLVGVGESKARAIGSINATDWLIDDYWKNLEDWKRNGGFAIKKRFSDKVGIYKVIKHHSDIYKLLREEGEK